MVFDELLERAREKEEKEARKRKRLEDDFLILLQSIKVCIALSINFLCIGWLIRGIFIPSSIWSSALLQDITASSKWESCKEIFDGSREYRYYLPNW